MREYYKTPEGKKRVKRAQLKYRKNNPEKFKAYYKKQKLIRKELLSILKKSLGGKCLRCGYNEFEVALDIHHIKNKPKFYRDPVKLKKANLEDLSLLCSNCHRALTCGFVEESDLLK